MTSTIIRQEILRIEREIKNLTKSSNYSTFKLELLELEKLEKSMDFQEAKYEEENGKGSFVDALNI